jgi:hypothetical protein
MIRMITSRRIIWAGHVVSMMQMRNSYNILVGKLLGKRNLGDLGNAGRIIIRWILEK